VVRVGKVEAATIQDWCPEPGNLVSWAPSAASLTKASQAPISTVPPSYMQTQHLRNYCAYVDNGQEMSRLVISGWNVPGKCDIRTMTHVINTHLRRHDTYRSWFKPTDDGQFVRHTLEKSRDIQFVAVEHGETTAEQFRDHIMETPTPLAWDCFRFAIIQRSDHFLFCATIDHLHCDAMIVTTAFAEIQMMYSALVKGVAPSRLPEAGSYVEYCARQRDYTSGLTLASPEVREWVDFFEANNGKLPDHPVPLGDTSIPCTLTGERLLDERQTAAFEAACTAAGVRFCGGVFAANALVEHRLTGNDTYRAIIPVDIRQSEADFMTSGWFTGFVPITVPVAGSCFADVARAAQSSFDSGRDLAQVPLDRVLELAPWLREGDWGAPLVFYLDAGCPPLSALVHSQVDGLGAGLYHDGGLLRQLNVRVNRLENETQLTLLYPNNQTARESVARYVEALKSVMIRIAEGREVMPAPRRNGQLHLAYSRREAFAEASTKTDSLSSWLIG
jgi:mycolipenoyl-CoA---2-(long-chain-fatty acyl)-trehalose mycolipenoyltransferase / long-chain-acyl-CoA---trehalose acyltransferase